MKKRKGFLCGLAVGVMIMAASAVSAATITTADGVLSIETPSDAWAQSQDPNYWFVITDGSNSITIDHLSNGEALPASTVANAQYPEVYQALVSTQNEVFAIKGLASQAGSLQNLMQIIGTIKILKPGTKTAIQAAQAPQTNQFGLRPINAVYYSTGDDVSIRNGCSVDNDKIGSLNRGNQVTVNGAVTLNGADYGWYEIQFNGGKGYVNASYLSPNTPTSAAATKQPQTSSQSQGLTIVGEGISLYDANGDFWGQIWEYSDGTFRDDAMNKWDYLRNGTWTCGGETLYASNAVPDQASNTDSNEERVQCPYCGEWFEPGNDYRNHVMAAHQEQINQEAEDQDTSVQCPYCGESFAAGNDYRNHVMAAHSDELSDEDKDEDITEDTGDEEQ